MKQTQIGNLRKLTAENGVIHKIGTDTYAKSIIMLPTDTLDMYEEVAEKPAYTKEQYDAKVNELVREKYSESEEFAIQRKAINASFSPAATASDNAAFEEYQTYNAYVDECKEKAKDPELYKTPDEGENAGEENIDNINADNEDTEG